MGPKRIDKPPDTYTGNQAEWDLLSAMQQYQQFHASRIREQKRISYMKNKAKIAVSTASYRRKNKESIAVTKKKYQQFHASRIREQKRTSYMKNKAKHAVTQASYRRKNKESILATKKKNCIANAVQQRAYRVKNKERIAANRNKYHTKNTVQLRAYRLKNKERISANRKKYKNDNKDKIRKVDLMYNQKNHEKINTKQRARTVKRRQALYERIAMAVAASNKEIAERA